MRAKTRKKLELQQQKRYKTFYLSKMCFSKQDIILHLFEYKYCGYYTKNKQQINKIIKLRRSYVYSNTTTITHRSKHKYIDIQTHLQDNATYRFTV